MIYCSINDCSKYENLNPHFRKAFDWIKKTDLSIIPEGRIILVNDELFINIQRIITKDITEGFFEAHKKYIDIHLLYSGLERIDISNISSLTELSNWDNQTDFQKLNGEAEKTVILTPGNLLFCFPEDGHRCCLHADNKTETLLNKIVIKVRVK